jgi:hypothetical protein
MIARRSADVTVLWTEGRWRCELHTADNPQVGRLVVYQQG